MALLSQRCYTALLSTNTAKGWIQQIYSRVSEIFTHFAFGSLLQCTGTIDLPSQNQQLIHFFQGLRCTENSSAWAMNEHCGDYIWSHGRYFCMSWCNRGKGRVKFFSVKICEGTLMVTSILQGPPKFAISQAITSNHQIWIDLKRCKVKKHLNRFEWFSQVCTPQSFFHQPYTSDRLILGSFNGTARYVGRFPSLALALWHYFGYHLGCCKHHLEGWNERTDGWNERTDDGSTVFCWGAGYGFLVPLRWNKNCWIQFFQGVCFFF